MEIEYKKDGIEIGGNFVSLKYINEMCAEVNIKEQNLVLLELSWNGRGGSVLEQRTLPLKNALRVKEIILDREVYFGEIWGKHSEVCGTMCEKTIKIEQDSEKVKGFLKEFPSGIDYDHSFINTFIEVEEERLEWEAQNANEDDITQEELDELQSLL